MSDEIKAGIEKLSKTFHDFKVENNKLIENNTVEQNAKVEKISDRLNKMEEELEALEQVSARSTDNQMDIAKSEYSDTFFNEFMRKGNDSNIKALGVNASLSVTESDDGGITV